MAIKHPGGFHDALPANFDGIFDWDFLLPAFAGTKIEPTDIDAVVERFGRFLIFETKEPDKGIPDGQRIMLENLIKLGRGKIHVIILYGKTQASICRIEDWRYHKGQVIKEPKDCDATYVLEGTKKWFQGANRP